MILDIFILANCWISKQISSIVPFSLPSFFLSFFLFFFLLMIQGIYYYCIGFKHFNNVEHDLRPHRRTNSFNSQLKRTYNKLWQHYLGFVTGTKGSPKPASHLSSLWFQIIWTICTDTYWNGKQSLYYLWDQWPITPNMRLSGTNKQTKLYRENGLCFPSTCSQSKPLSL